MAVGCFTSFTFSYLDRARVLAKSLKKENPSYSINAYISDRRPTDLADSAFDCFDSVFYTEDIYGDGFPAFAFRHDVVELSTAVKGMCLAHMFGLGFEKVIYLDPDIAVFNSFTSIEEHLDLVNIVLTPHQLRYDDSRTAIVDNEIGSMKYGIYNLGFLAVANRSEGRRFANWWDSRLREFCYDDVPAGLFTDQRWCDHVPVFFDGVLILKDPGFNVASWNISQRRVRFANGRFHVGESPLVFFHFTKFSGVGAAMIARHAKDNFEVYELWEFYRRHLDAESQGITRTYWFWGAYSDGSLIPRCDRLMYRSRLDLQKFFVDPFDVEGNSLKAYLERNGCAGG